MAEVYLLECNLNGEITYKIGKTTRNIKERINELQTGNAGKIRVLFRHPTKNYNILEKTLHNIYSFYKIKNEWFTDINLQKFIENCKHYDKSLTLLKS